MLQHGRPLDLNWKLVQNVGAPESVLQKKFDLEDGVRQKITQWQGLMNREEEGLVKQDVIGGGRGGKC
jgi:hypothetical protein